MNKHIAIETQLGYLNGRNCIFLGDALFKKGVSELLLKGEINQNLCSKKLQGLDVPFSITFFDILALKIVELDSWDYCSSSCFDEVIDSSWMQELSGKVNENYHHFLFQTYDDVFEVVCLRYEFITPL